MRPGTAGPAAGQAQPGPPVAPIPHWCWPTRCSVRRGLPGNGTINNIAPSVEAIRAYQEAGFDEVYLGQVGGRIEDAFAILAADVLPRVRGN